MFTSETMLYANKVPFACRSTLQLAACNLLLLRHLLTSRQFWHLPRSFSLY
jgi:hypothetical protein